MKRSQTTRGRSAPSGVRAKKRAHTLSARAVLLMMLCGVMALALPIARGQERNFAGSVQGSYLYANDMDGKPARNRGLDGFTTEMSAKLAVDFGEHVSTTVKMCFGCHGFEVGMAFVDMNVADELRFRVGRFTPVVRRVHAAPRPGQPPHGGQAAALRHGAHAARQRVELGRAALAPTSTTASRSRARTGSATRSSSTTRPTPSSGLRGDNDGTDVDFIQTRTCFTTSTTTRAPPGVAACRAHSTSRTVRCRSRSAPRACGASTIPTTSCRT